MAESTRAVLIDCSATDASRSRAEHGRCKAENVEPENGEEEEGPELSLADSGGEIFSLYAILLSYFLTPIVHASHPPFAASLAPLTNPMSECR